MAHDEHVARSMVDDPMARAAEQERCEITAAPAADDEQVGIHTDGMSDERIWGIPFEVDPVDRHGRAADDGAHPVPHLVVLRGEQRRRDVGDNHGVALGSQLAGEADGGTKGILACGAVIEADDDLHCGHCSGGYRCSFSASMRAAYAAASLRRLISSLASTLET